MLAATWILAIATAALAIEGGTAVWKYLRIRPGRTRRELDAINREISLLRNAAWMAASKVNQGPQAKIDERVRSLLASGGWQPDMPLLEQHGYFHYGRLLGGGTSGGTAQ